VEDFNIFTLFNNSTFYLAEGFVTLVLSTNFIFPFNEI